MKKILHMTPPDINNGVYRYIFNHMPYIDQNEYCFEFLTRNRQDLMATKEYKQYHFMIRSFQNTERESKNGLREEMMDILGSGYDAIHLHTSFWRGFLIEEVAMELQIPHVIVHSHSTGIDFTDEEERNKLLQIHEGYKRAFDFNKATDVCACSRLAGEWLFGSQIPQEEIKILPNAIEVEKYHYQPKVRRKMREKLGIENRIVIGNVGRYCYQKNHRFLVRAFSKALEQNPKLFLILIGQGELEDGICAFVKELGIENSVLCLGWQANIEDYLQAMDVFCLPSLFEGFPISVIEAQAAGLPCFVADTVTREAGITDLVSFMPLDEEIWCQALAGCRAEHSRERVDELIGKKGYDIKMAAGRLRELYC